MTVERQVLFWVVALGVFVGALWLFSGILLPFVAGLVLAYLLDPLADRLQAIGLSRLVATIVILALFVLLFIVALFGIVPFIASDLARFIARIPDYARQLQDIVTTRGWPLLERLGIGTSLPELQSSFSDFIGKGMSWIGNVVASVWTGSQALLGVVSLVVVTPVVAFYLLVDWDDMIANVDGWVPLRHRETVRQLAREVNDAIAGFIRGQALVCLLLGTWYAVGLSLVGLNFGFVIGIISGFLSFIPYVGSLTGLVLSVGVAVVQFWPDGLKIGLVLAVFFSGQFLEGNILSPKLVGHAIGLHPVWLMFALFAFGSLFGFVGLLLAVPLAAMAGVLARFALRQYLASPIYSGRPAPRPVEPLIDA